MSPRNVRYLPSRRDAWSGAILFAILAVVMAAMMGLAYSGMSVAVNHVHLP